jgi:hypothetical protein
MEHVLSPAAAIIRKVNGFVIDEKGEHDLSPKSDDDPPEKCQEQTCPASFDHFVCMNKKAFRKV